MSMLWSFRRLPWITSCADGGNRRGIVVIGATDAARRSPRLFRLGNVVAINIFYDAKLFVWGVEGGGGGPVPPPEGRRGAAGMRYSIAIRRTLCGFLQRKAAFVDSATSRSATNFTQNDR